MSSSTPPREPSVSGCGERAAAVAARALIALSPPPSSPELPPTATCPCGLVRASGKTPPEWIWCPVCKVSVTDGVVAACYCGKLEPPHEDSPGRNVDWITCTECKTESHAECYKDERCDDAAAAAGSSSESPRPFVCYACRNKAAPPSDSVLYSCRLCYCKCGQLASIKKHMRTYHQLAREEYTEEPFRGKVSCDLCSWIGTTPAIYSRHMSSTHHIRSGHARASAGPAGAEQTPAAKAAVAAIADSSLAASAVSKAPPPAKKRAHSQSAVVSLDDDDDDDSLAAAASQRASQKAKAQRVDETRMPGIKRCIFLESWPIRLRIESARVLFGIKKPAGKLSLLQVSRDTGHLRKLADILRAAADEIELEDKE